MKAVRRKQSRRDALLVARAQNSAFRRVLKSLPERALEPPVSAPLDPALTLLPASDPDRFVHAWAVSRGYSSISMALDASGRVWELKTAFVAGSNPKQVEAQWWERLSMERR